MTITDFGGNKCVVGVDGTVFSVPLSAEEIAQQQVDSAAAVVRFGQRNVDGLLDAKLTAGFNDPVTGKTWQCDSESRGNWSSLASSAGLAMALGVSPLPTFTLIAADNTQIALSAADTLALFQNRVMPWVSACVLYARSLKDQYIAGTPPADITQGWPT